MRNSTGRSSKNGYLDLYSQEKLGDFLPWNKLLLEVGSSDQLQQLKYNQQSIMDQTAETRRYFCQKKGRIATMVPNVWSVDQNGPFRYMQK